MTNKDANPAALAYIGMTREDYVSAIAAYHSAKNETDYAASRLKWNEVNQYRTQIQEKFGDMFTKCVDFSIGVGWWLPLVDCLIEIRTIMEQYPDFVFHVRQVKEKFGGIRFHYQIEHIDEHEEREFPLIPEDLYNLIYDVSDKLMSACSSRCEVCGAPGEQRLGGWIKNLCDDHTSHKSAH